VLGIGLVSEMYTGIGSVGVVKCVGGDVWSSM